MEHAELLFVIGRYCKDKNFQMTLKALDRKTDKCTEHKKSTERSVVELFEKYFKLKNEGEGLSFTFKLTNKRSQLRKRLRDNESARPVGIKQMKVIKPRKNDIPDTFLKLLDELGLDRKNAKLLYENKDQWTYVKSDRLIYCAESGKFSSKKF